MSQLKSYFILPWMLGLFVASIHSAGMLVFSQDKLAWLGAMLATLPQLGFFGYIAKAGIARTSRYLPLQLGSALAGTLLAASQSASLPLLYAGVIGLGGILAYTFWYSNLGRPQSNALQTGMRFPDFSLLDAEGQSVTLDKLSGKRSLLLFYRGNWCPLCVTQVEELADQYRELAARDVQVCFISPQSATETAKLAKRFDIPALFLADIDNQLARALDIVHSAGIPKGMGLGGEDTVFPTVVILSSEGNVLWVDETDNYRLRPEPDTFLQVLDALG